MLTEHLEDWLATFDGDDWTRSVVTALVDVALAAGAVFAGHQSIDDDLSPEARRAIEALEDLEALLDQVQDEAQPIALDA